MVFYRHHTSEGASGRRLPQIHDCPTGAKPEAARICVAAIKLEMRAGSPSLAFDGPTASWEFMPSQRRSGGTKSPKEARRERFSSDVRLKIATLKNKSQSASSASSLLSERVQQWLAKNHWTLRPVQEKAIPRLLRALENQESKDFVISAPTASGKTEAVFLPIASLIEEWETKAPGAKVLYICPLKALIDQQAERLGNGLFDAKNYPVTPWHGGAKQAGKKRFENDPRGVVIITPESLEAQFIKRGGHLGKFYGNLRCVVIDEFHAFFNSSRGYQLLSQLNRLEKLVAKRRIPRIALSATFNEETCRQVQMQLRPQQPDMVEFIEDDTSDRTLEFRVSCFSEDPGPQARDRVQSRRDERIVKQILSDFSILASKRDGECQKGLIFVNSRQQGETFAERLRSGGEGGPIKFLLHHGSLGRSQVGSCQGLAR